MEDRLELNDRQDSFSIAEMIGDVQDRNTQPDSGGSAPFSHMLNNLVPEWMNGILNQSNFGEDKTEELQERDEEEQSEGEESSDSSASVKETPSSLFTIKTQREWPWKRKLPIGL